MSAPAALTNAQPTTHSLSAAVVTNNYSERGVELDHLDVLVVKGSDATNGKLV